MGWLDRLLDKLEESSNTSKPLEKGEVSEDLIEQYFRLRYKIESDLSKIGDSDYERCRTLQKQIERAGVNVESRYRRFKAERMSTPEEESETLDVAEDMLQEPAETEEKTIYHHIKKGEEIVTKRERQIIGRGGGAKITIIITVPVAACGKKLSSHDEIAGFCAVCQEAACSEHAKHCVGYEGFPCNKLLCGNHTIYFTEQDGTEQPCCLDHYEMKIWLEKNPPLFDSKPGRKRKGSEKDEDDE